MRSADDARRRSIFRSVVRPRVSDSLTRAAERGVVVVAAGSGYGKSTAVRHVVEEAAGPGVVIRTPLGAGPAAIVRALVASTSSAFVPGWGEQLPDEAATCGAIERRLAEHLRNHDVRWVVVDDLSDALPAARRFVADFARATAPGTTWYLVIRDRGDLELAPLIANGNLREPLLAAELAFDAADVRRLADALDLGISAEHVRAVLDATGGWPVAVALALLHREGPVLRDGLPTAASIALAAYAAEHLTTAMDDAEREVLSWFAYVPGSRTTLEALAPPGSAAVLDRLARRLPLVRRTAEGWALHDVLLGPLRTAEELRDARDRRARRERAGAVLHAAGEPVNALRSYLVGDCTEALLRLLASEGERLRERGFVAEVESALKHLCRGASVPRELLVLAAAGEIDAGNHERAEALLRDAVRDGRAEARTGAVRLATLLVNRGASGAVEALRDTAARFADDPEVQSAFAVALAGENDRPGAEAAIAAALPAIRRASDPLTIAHAFQRLGIAHFFLMQHDLARERGEAALAVAASEGFAAVAARVRSLFYALAVAADDDEAMRREARAMADDARRACLPALEATALTALLAEAAERGDDAQCRDIEHALAGRGPVRGYADAFPLALARAAVHASAGRPAAGAAVLQRLLRERRLPIDLDVCALAVAALLESDDREAGRRAVLRLRAAADDLHVTLRGATARAVTLTFAAIAALEARFGQRVYARRAASRASASATTRRERALATCAHALASAEGREAWNEALAGLRAANLAGVAAIFDYVRPHHANVIAPRLTDVERELLRLYCGRREAKDVAAMTGRNVRTVRKHLQNAMTKLGAHSREEAIVIAAEHAVFAGAPT